MNMRRNRERGPFEGVREKPLLFLAVTASLFAGAVFGAYGLMIGSPVEKRIRAETVVLDVEAASPSSLIQRFPADPEGLQHVIQNAISSNGEIAEDAQEIDGLKIEEVIRKARSSSRWLVMRISRQSTR